MTAAKILCKIIELFADEIVEELKIQKADEIYRLLDEAERLLNEEEYHEPIINADVPPQIQQAAAQAPKSADEYRRLKSKFFDTSEIESMSAHILKISKEYADAKLAGIKPFEIRKNDRGFAVGDTVEYAVVDEDGAVILGHRLNGAVFIIDYITDYAQKDGYVVFTDRLIHIPNA